MKDTGARLSIEELRDAIIKVDEYATKIGARVKMLEENKNLSVRHCEKCKHDTLQRGHNEAIPTITGFGRVSWDYNDYSYCLNCGTKWQCETKEVCKEIK